MKFWREHIDWLLFLSFVLFFGLGIGLRLQWPFLEEVNAFFAQTAEALHGDLLNNIMTGLTNIASHTGGNIINLLLIALLWRKGWHRSALYVFLAVLGSYAAVWALKHYFSLPRPIGSLIVESGYSFPSGHTTLAFTTAFVVIIGVIQFSTLTFKKKVLTSFVLFMLAGLIAYSRVYLGVHTVSDIMAGMLLAFMVSACFYKLFKHFYTPPEWG